MQIALATSGFSSIVSDPQSNMSLIGQAPQLVSPDVPVQTASEDPSETIDVSSLPIQKFHRSDEAKLQRFFEAQFPREFAVLVAHEQLHLLQTHAHARRRQMALVRLAAAFALGASVVTGLITSAFNISNASAIQVSAALGAAAAGGAAAALLRRRSALRDS